jgi:hypothetical protein
MQFRLDEPARRIEDEGQTFLDRVNEGDEPLSITFVHRRTLRRT